MTMKKKLLTTLSVVLILGLAALGILAYLTDTDIDENVMTTGKVDIEQSEYDGAGQEVTDGNFGKLLPGTEVDKVVKVKNVGISDCYTRTLVAFQVIGNNASYNYEYDLQGGYYAIDKDVFITVDNVKYEVIEFLHNDAIAKDTQVTSLTKVGMSAGATNADMPGEYKVLVLSQAVQTEGLANAEEALDTAFGNVSATMATVWFSGASNEAGNEIEVTPENAQAVLNEIGNGMTIQLTAGDYDVLTLAPAYGGATTELDSVTGHLTRSIDGLVIKGADNVMVDGIQVSPNDGDKISLNDIVIDGVTFTGVAHGFGCTTNAATLKNFTMKNSNISNAGDYSLVQLRKPENVTVTNCTVDGAYRLIGISHESKNVTVTSNTIKNVTSQGVHLANSGEIHSGTVVVSDNVFNVDNNARFIRFANVDNAELIITNNEVYGYTPTAGSENDYIKITTQDSSVEPDVTIYGNMYEYKDTRLWISINGAEYVQSTNDKLN